MKRAGIYSQPGPELKIVDLPDQINGYGSAGHVFPLPIPMEGSSFYNRVGRRTKGVSLQLRLIIDRTYNNEVRIGCQYNRILIIYDRQANGAYPAVSDVILDYKNDGTTNLDEFSMPNPNNKDRFVILRDIGLMTPDIDSHGDAYNNVLQTQWESLKLDLYIKLKGLETIYKASTGAIGDVTTGSFFMIAINDDSNFTPAWKLDFSARYKFFD